jgi:hypothetical protein
MEDQHLFQLLAVLRPGLDLRSFASIIICSKRTKHLCSVLVKQQACCIILAAAATKGVPPNEHASIARIICEAAGRDACSSPAVATAVVAVPVHPAVKQVLLLAGVAPTAQQLLHAAACDSVLRLEEWMNPSNSSWSSTCPLVKAVCRNDEVNSKPWPALYTGATSPCRTEFTQDHAAFVLFPLELLRAGSCIA